MDGWPGGLVPGERSTHCAALLHLAAVQPRTEPACRCVGRTRTTAPAPPRPAPPPLRGPCLHLTHKVFNPLSPTTHSLNASVARGDTIWRGQRGMHQGRTTTKVPSRRPPRYARDLSHLVAAGVFGVTTCIHFPGYLNYDLCKLTVNPSPFPRLSFFMCGFAQLTSRGPQQNVALAVSGANRKMFDCKIIMCASDPPYDRCLAASVFPCCSMSYKNFNDGILSGACNNKNPSRTSPSGPRTNPSYLCAASAVPQGG